jgi:hypothetical protein
MIKGSSDPREKDRDLATLYKDNIALKKKVEVLEARNKELTAAAASTGFKSTTAKKPLQSANWEEEVLMLRIEN